MDKFVHLHLHTEYSLLDGATRINKLFKRCEELNMPAVAMTDHGNMFGALEFFKAAVKFTDPEANPFKFLSSGKEFKVKPIIGCEFYMCDDMRVRTTINGRMPKFNHLVLLAKNETGYKNLIKLASKAYTDGFYYKPRIDMPCLEGHTEGLICLSACLAGAIPQALLHNDTAKADEYVAKFKDLFKDDFYIEIQDHGIRDQKAVLPLLIETARRNNVKLVATNDTHYLKKSDSTMQKVLQCIAFKNTMSVDELDGGDDMSEGAYEDDAYFPTKEFYLKSRDEMAELFPNHEEALNNTLEIANKCSCDFFRRESLLPEYEPEGGLTPYEFLRKITYDGLNKKYKVMSDEVIERAEYELNMINNMKFVDYFLVVWDFIHYSETHDIPVGPGRGSGAGSIVAYAIGITKVDPLKYALIFERFINPERVSMPDFDIDFCVDKREDVIKYVVEKYGEKNVSQIVTFGTLAAKAAIKDVGRVFNYPYAEVDKITKLMPKMMGKNHIGHLIGKLPPPKDSPNPIIPDLVEMYEHDAMTEKILNMAMDIEGMPRQTGMHAAGVIICRDDISDHVPMALSPEGIVTTEFNMIECEELGLLKMDFLGLRTLTDIDKAIVIIQKTKGVKIDFYDMDYDDEGVFKMIGEGDTHAVFQLESEGMKKFMRDLKPTSLEDIIAGISLYRPGPMDFIKDYVDNKRDPSQIVYDHPKCVPILNVTYGIMVYQEQVMQLVRELAGYSLGRADMVRRMMSKKKKDEMDKERQVFLFGTKDGVVPGCVKNGVPEDIANRIYDAMMKFASYAFNKSHAAAYAYLAYQTAYLKCYHLVEFFTAVLNNRITSIDEITNYLTFLKDRGVKVLPPNINKSYAEFTVEDNCVRIGMAAIKNVGVGIISEIVAERDRGGDFNNFEQFVERMSNVTLNKKMLESLIFSGTFDIFGHTRATLMNVYETVLDRAAKDKAAKDRGQFSFFDQMDVTINTFKYPVVKEFSLSEKLKNEKEVSGVYLTGHPLEEYSEHLNTYQFNTSMLKNVNEEDEENETELKDDMTVTLGGMLIEADRRITKTGREMGIGRLEDLYGTVEVVVPPFRWQQLKNVWQKDKLVSLTGKLRSNDGIFSVSADKIQEWKAAADSKPRKICMYLSFSQSKPDIMDTIQDILSAYPGKDLSYVKNNDDNKIYSLNIDVTIGDTMLAELIGVVGEGNIKIAE